MIPSQFSSKRKATFSKDENNKEIKSILVYINFLQCRVGIARSQHPHRSLKIIVSSMASKPLD